MRNYELYLETYSFEDVLEMNELTEEDVLKILDEAGCLDFNNYPEPLPWLKNKCVLCLLQRNQIGFQLAEPLGGLWFYWINIVKHPKNKLERKQVEEKKLQKTQRPTRSARARKAQESDDAVRSALRDSRS